MGRAHKEIKPWNLLLYFFLIVFIFSSEIKAFRGFKNFVVFDYFNKVTEELSLDVFSFLHSGCEDWEALLINKRMEDCGGFY